MAVAAAAWLPAYGAAQGLAVEARAGAAIGSYSATAAGLETVPDLSMGAAVEVSVAWGLAASLAYGRSAFGCEDGFCDGREVRVTSHGVALGVTWTRSLVWARAAALYHGVVLAGLGGRESVGSGLGFEFAAGLALAGRGPLRWRPGLVIRRHSVSAPDGDAHAAVIAFELAARVPLGG